MIDGVTDGVTDFVDGCEVPIAELDHVRIVDILGFIDTVFVVVELVDGEIVSVFGTDVAIGDDDCVTVWKYDLDTDCVTVFVLGNDVTTGDGLFVIVWVTDT